MIFIFLQLFFKIAPFLSEIHPMSAELFFGKNKPCFTVDFERKTGNRCQRNFLTDVSGIFTFSDFFLSCFIAFLISQLFKGCFINNLQETIKSTF
mgnify:CR=1 FL=1